MTEVHFFPAYARVLDEVVRSAHDQGVIDVECRPGLDPAVVAGQLHRYAAETRAAAAVHRPARPSGGARPATSRLGHRKPVTHDGCHAETGMAGTGQRRRA